MSAGFKVDDLGSTQRPSWETSSSLTSSTAPPRPHRTLAIITTWKNSTCAVRASRSLTTACVYQSPLPGSLGFRPSSLPPHPHLNHSGFASHWSWGVGPQGCPVSVMFTLTPWGLGITGFCQSQHTYPVAWLPHSFLL